MKPMTLNEALKAAGLPQKKLDEARQQFTDPQEFQSFLDNKYNAATEMWMSAAKVKELMKHWNDGAEIKSISQEAGAGNDKEKLDARTKSLTDKGWTMFGKAKNADAHDMVFVKPKK